MVLHFLHLDLNCIALSQSESSIMYIISSINYFYYTWIAFVGWAPTYWNTLMETQRQLTCYINSLSLLVCYKAKTGLEELGNI